MELGIMAMFGPHQAEWAAELGIKWAGVPMLPIAYEDVDNVLKDVDMLASYGVKPHGIIQIPPGNLTHPSFFHRFGADLRWAVRTFPYESVEVWPEPSCPYVTQNRFRDVDYAMVMACAYENIKEANPNVTVFNGGIGQHGCMWGVERFINLAIDYTDVLNLHPFLFDAKWNRVVELMSGLVSRVLIHMTDIGKVKPMSATEWGYPTHKRETVYGTYASYIDPLEVPPLAMEDQANVVRETLRMFDPMLVRFHMTYIQDHNTENHWSGWTGLVTMDGRKKPAYHEWAKFVRDKEVVKHGRFERSLFAERVSVPSL